MSTSEELSQLQLDREDIEVVPQFVFLCSSVTRHGDCCKEIERRIGLGWAEMTGQTRVWKEREVSVTTIPELLSLWFTML